MGMLADTPAHIEAEVIATLRSLSPARRLELARAMNRMADRLALAGIQRRKPGAGPHEQGLALALQRLTPEQHAYGSTLLDSPLCPRRLTRWPWPSALGPPSTRRPSPT